MQSGPDKKPQVGLAVTNLFLTEGLSHGREAGTNMPVPAKGTALPVTGLCFLLQVVDVWNWGFLLPADLWASPSPDPRSCSSAPDPALGSPHSGSGVLGVITSREPE